MAAAPAAPRTAASGRTGTRRPPRAAARARRGWRRRACSPWTSRVFAVMPAPEHRELAEVGVHPDEPVRRAMPAERPGEEREAACHRELNAGANEESRPYRQCHAAVAPGERVSRV